MSGFPENVRMFLKMEVSYQDKLCRYRAQLLITFRLAVNLVTIEDQIVII